MILVEMAFDNNKSYCLSQSMRWYLPTITLTIFAGMKTCLYSLSTSNCVCTAKNISGTAIDNADNWLAEFEKLALLELRK